MDIIQLKYFVAVAVSGSFSEAADIMFSAQSTVSKQISSLEKDLNIVLFDRSKRKVSLTPHGKVFLGYAQTFLENYNLMLADLVQLSEADDSTVKIRTTPVMIPYNILTLLSNFRKANSWVKMQVEEFEGEDVLKMLRENECDLAFFRVGKFDDTLYEKIVIYTEKLVAALPANHPLAKEKSISLKQLAQENFLMFRKGNGLHRISVGACHDAGFEPNIIATTSRMANIFEMVSKDMGVGLMLEKAAKVTLAEFGSEEVILVPLKEVFQMEVAIARYKKKHHNKASQALWEYIEKSSKNANT